MVWIKTKIEFRDGDDLWFEHSYINLNAVREIEVEDLGRGRKSSVIDHDGMPHPVDGDWWDVEIALATIVPDTRGSLLHTLWYSKHPGAEEIIHEVHAVIAWRILPGNNAPVLPIIATGSDGLEIDHDHSPEGMMLLENPDGSVHDTCRDMRYPSLEAAREELMRRNRAVDRDRKTEPKNEETNTPPRRSRRS
jgi:hypothetical protein